MNSSELSTFPFGQSVRWHPNPDWIAASNLQAFMHQHGISSYDELMQRSTADIVWFWDAVIKQLDIRFEQPYSRVFDPGEDPRLPRWCIGGKMNITISCLDKWQGTLVWQSPAFIWEGEEGKSLTLTYEQLHREVNRCANALRALGLGKGDAIGLYMPMIPELVIAFLAIARIGGIILPLFSGYGPSAIISRLENAGAKALFTADGVLRRGKAVAMKSVADEALQQLPGVEHVIVAARAQLGDTPMQPGRDHWWHEMIPSQAAEAAAEVTDAEDTVMLIYTSGTTGTPKGAVHTHCGFPIKAAQDMFHAMDVKRGEVMYWMTDMGWMMGPWEVFGTLLIGASMVFYDGAPDFPAEDRLWALVAKHGITHLGVSPTLIRVLKSHGTGPVEKHDISSLRAVGSTGSPWDPESWLWLFENVLGGEKPILNYSGGTEISGGIVCGNFFKPLKPCAFSGPVPGMAADVVDENGESVRGKVGELVIRAPWIGMTRGFWHNNARYFDTYWSRFEGVWLHGDFAAVDEDGLWYILGRSDDTIKVAGKRLGPAEVESILNAHPQVAESAAIGVPHAVKDNEVVAFCVLNDPQAASESLRQELVQALVHELGKPLKPKEIKFVRALPKTRNAKVMHRIIRATYLGESPGDLSSLENPDTVQAIRDAV